MSLRKASSRLTGFDSLLSRSILRLVSRHCSRTFSSRQATKEEIAKSCELFEYTSGRWVFNESSRLAERRLPFDFDELLKAAAKSINKTTSDIKSFRKLAEGRFNRVFDISMKDGSSVLARLPYPSTLPQRLAIASEVATLDFVRAHGIPTPRVLGYSVVENNVGAEYMLIEKVPGKPLGNSWLDISKKQRLKVLLQIVELEAKLFAINLPASGSIYYARDLVPGTPRVDIPGSDHGLCVGPYAALGWWYGERGGLDIDRGPHADPHLALKAPAEKEMAWIRAYGRPRFPFDRSYRETFDFQKQNPEEHVSSLAEYIRLAPHLIPPSPKLNQPVLRHPDLQPDNIFVSEDFRITGLIDWQYSVVLPTFLAAGIPRRFQNHADEESHTFVPPKLPDNLDSMNEEQRSRVQEQFRRRHIHFFYLGFTQRLNRPHWHVLDQEAALLKPRIFDRAGSPWEGLNTPLQMDLLMMSQNWSKIARAGPDGTIPECPLAISEEEAERRTALNDSLCEADAEMEQINRSLGVTADGWVSHEAFEDAKEGARVVREFALASVDDEPWLREMSERHWPLDDCDEDE